MLQHKGYFCFPPKNRSENMGVAPQRQPRETLVSSGTSSTARNASFLYCLAISRAAAANRNR